MTFNEVINAVEGSFNTCGIVSVKCTIKTNRGNVYDTDIIVANCDEDDYEDYYADVVENDKHWHICCGADDFIDYCEYELRGEILAFHSVDKFISDFH